MQPSSELSGPGPDSAVAAAYAPTPVWRQRFYFPVPAKFTLVLVCSVLWTALSVLLLPWAAVIPVFVVLFAPAAVPQLRRDVADLVTGTEVRFIGDITDPE